MANQFKSSVYNAWVNTPDSLWNKARLKVIASVVEAWHVAAIPKAITESYNLVEEKSEVVDQDKFIKLTTDNTKVDSDQTDAPVLISLNSSSGINDYDFDRFMDTINTAEKIEHVIPDDAVYIGPEGTPYGSGVRNSPVNSLYSAMPLVPQGGTIVFLPGHCYETEQFVPGSYGIDNMTITSLDGDFRNTH